MGIARLEDLASHALGTIWNDETLPKHRKGQAHGTLKITVHGDEGYLLDDNSLISLTAKRAFAANGENIDGIGVAVDYQAPMTAKDLSTGRDPAVEKALSLLTE